VSVSLKRCKLLDAQRRWAPAALVLMAILGACGGSAQPSPASSAAGASSIPAWDQAVASARKEGKIVLSGPPSQVWRTALTAFEKDYPEINVEYTGTTSRDFWPRIAQEQKSGQYLWDLRVGGPDPSVFAARDQGMLAPIKPLLILPEATDEGQWFGAAQDLVWADTAKQYMRNFLAYGSSQIMVNRDLVPADAFNSGKQLIDPKWKGKMVLQDPRGGSGLGSVTTIMVAYGEDFLRTLLSQQALAVTADNRQEAEWLVRGNYVIGIGNVSDELVSFKQQGLNANVALLDDAPPSLSIGFGSTQLLKNAPHPNATKVFVNWLLTQKAQANLVKTVQSVNSLRLDVPPGLPDGVLDPKRLNDYIPHQYERLLATRQKAEQLSNELLK
jgi:iron(III) transport system substrate-binding protein